MTAKTSVQTRTSDPRGRNNPRAKQARAASPSVNSLVNLQHSAGNLAVQRLLQSCLIQAKLSISALGDPFEQQADSVSEIVMRFPDGPCPACEEKEEETRIHAKPLASQITPLVQCESDRPLEDEKERVAAAKPDIQRVPVGFEPRFGADFSGVRVHTDTRAAGTATSIKAKAFTVGWDIAFGTGQYAPESHEGRQLLAHELTHVVQQEAGPVSGTPIAGRVAISDPSDSYEQAASQSARVMVKELPNKSAVPVSSVPAIQRQEAASALTVTERPNNEFFNRNEVENIRARATARYMRLSAYVGTGASVINSVKDRLVSDNSRYRQAYGNMHKPSGLLAGKPRTSSNGSTFSSASVSESLWGSPAKLC